MSEITGSLSKKMRTINKEKDIKLFCFTELVNSIEGNAKLSEK